MQVFSGTTLVRTVSGISPTASTQLVTGLVNGTSYTATVTAFNAAGFGSTSPAAPAATIPAAPIIGTATPGTRQATVRWTPGFDGGSPITSFQVQVRTGTTVVRTITGIAPTAVSLVVTGLTNGTAYNFRVRAVNALGTGPLSAASNVVRPANVPGAPGPGQQRRFADHRVPRDGVADERRWRGPGDDGLAGRPRHRPVAVDDPAGR